MPGQSGRDLPALRALLDLAGPALHAQVADGGAGDAGDDAAEAAEVAPDLGELDAVDGLCLGVWFADHDHVRSYRYVN